MSQRSSSARTGRRSCLAVLPLVLLSIVGATAILKLSNNLATSGPFKRAVRETFKRFTPYDSVNQILNTCVTFFRFASSASPIAPALMRSFVYAAFLPAVGLLQLESRKRSNALWVQWSPLLVGLLAQTCSAMVILPLWLSAFLMFGPGEGRHRARQDRGDEMRAVLPAVVLGYVVPSLLVDNPLVPLSPQAQDWANAVWQVFPLTISLLVPLLEAILPHSNATAHRAEQSTLLWISALCRLMHLSTLYELFLYAAHNNLSLRQMGELAWRPVRKVSPVQRSAYEFLLSDIALSATAMVIFILLVPGGRRTSRLRLAGVMVLSAPVQGLGAALVWGWRTTRSEAARVRPRPE